MKKFLKYALPCAGILMLAACGDDSSSSAQVSSNTKYILDEANQRFALIYDRCLISENSTRWDENVDTTWFHYKFVSDTLVVFKDCNTSGFKAAHCQTEMDRNGGTLSFDEEHGDEALILVGGHSGDIFATWKSTSEGCFYIESKGTIECGDDEGVWINGSIFTLNVSKNNLNFYWKLNSEYCPSDDLEFDIENGDGGLLPGSFDLDIEEASIKAVDCNTVKFQVNGKSVTATMFVDIDSDNIATTKLTYTSEDQSCSYTAREVDNMLQYPESICNTKEFSKYSYTPKDLERLPAYLPSYKKDKVAYKDFVSCMSEMLDAE